MRWLPARWRGRSAVFFFLVGGARRGCTSFMETKSTANRLMNLFLLILTNWFQWVVVKEIRVRTARSRVGGEFRVMKSRRLAWYMLQLKKSVASQSRVLRVLDARSASWARKEEARKRG